MITDAFIRSMASSTSYQRGQSYYDQGSVQSLVRRGDELVAEVEGSQYTPYQVRVEFEGEDVVQALCDCPYDWGGWCKHIVAVLLVCLHEPEHIEQRPGREDLLADLDADRLRALVRDLMQRHPRLTAEVESWLALRSPGATGPQEAPSVDPAPIRRRVREIMHSIDHMRPSEAYWHVGGLYNELRQVLDDIRAVTERGDGRWALTLLEAFTDAYAQHWMYLDDSDGESFIFLQDVGQVWAEALLTAEDLSDADRRHWVEKLNAWLDEFRDYGLEEAFEVARLAAEYGWEATWVEAGGDAASYYEDAWYDYDPHAALQEARLNVLERQERYDEFLQRAQDAGHYGRYAVMLVQLDRIDEAVEAGTRMLNQATDALKLARALYERGAVEAALEVAEHGLTLDGGYAKGDLAAWLRDTADQEGKTEQAVAAALTTVELRPSLDAYLKAQQLAGENWEVQRSALLEKLRQRSHTAEGTVDIFLHEGHVDDAITIVQQGYVGYDLLRRVVDAAIETRPEWARETARKQAEEIMDQGRSQHYHHAVDWVRRVREAYRAQERDDEWRAYRAGLIEKHKRKYKLRPMLEEL